MKIIDWSDESDEPQECSKCGNEYNGFYDVGLELFKGYCIQISLCKICYKQLKKKVKLK